MLGLDGLEFVEQAVIFEVADQRRIQHMIAVVVQVDLFFEFFVMGFCVHAVIIPHSVDARIAKRGMIAQARCFLHEPHNSY